MMEWEQIKERYSQFWKKENKTPILLLKGMKGKYPYPKEPKSMKECWTDVDYLIEKERTNIKNMYFLGDAYPLVNPNLGPDIFGATFGADLIFQSETSYSVPFVQDDWEEPLIFDEDNCWWKKIKEITRAFVEDSRGEYMVGISDLHAGADGLVSVRGSQNLCYDLLDCPEVFRKTSEILLPAFKKQFEALYAMTQKCQKGTSNWMGIYKDEPWYVTSSDFICMISREHFQELILPELKEEINYLKGNTIFHLDGPDALKHLDDLLEISNLAGIQWVYGAGQPSARYWIDVLKKIQDAGKLINVGLQRGDAEEVFRALSPEGVSYYLDFDCSEEEAREILRLSEKYYL